MRDHTGLTRSLVADSALGPLRGLLLTLTVVTGVVDAVSILALGRVFVANMTGNVVFAAFAVVGAPGFSLSASLFALGGFLVGAYGGGVLIGRFVDDRGLLLRAGGAVELAFAAVALVVAATSGDPGVTHGTIGLTGGEFGAAATDAIAALLAIALGVQNAVARKLAVPDMTTTVLTMTLTGVGADIRAIFGDCPRAPVFGLRSEGVLRRAKGRAGVFGLRSEGARHERLSDEREDAGSGRPEASRAAEQPSDEGENRGFGRAEASGMTVRVRGAARSALGRRLLTVAAMIIGALAGASLTLRVSPLSGLALATALLTAVTAWVALATRRPAGWRAFPSARH